MKEQKIIEGFVDPLKIIEGLVDKLETAANDVKRIEFLQQIGKELVENCLLCVDGLEIEPLWVEAYYYDKARFPDCNTHLDDQQMEFDKLFFHKKADNRAGFDICLSKGNYYLSFLLKATIINERYCTQTGIHQILKERNMDKQELEKKNVYIRSKKKSAGCSIAYARRVGITKPCYQDAELSVYRRDLLPVYYFHHFARTVLEDTVVAYMRKFLEDNNEITKAQFKDECTREFGWCPEKVDALWKEAN